MNIQSIQAFGDTDSKYTRSVTERVYCIACVFAALCVLSVAPLHAGVSVTPLSEDVFSSQDSALGYAGPTGRLLSEEEWMRYSNRPNALGSAVNLAQNHPNGATGYVRDPAYLPILPLTTTTQKSGSKSRKAKATQVAPSPYGPTVASPVSPVVPMPVVSAPRIPTVAAPKVPAPHIPVVKGAGAVASPYSSVAAPTGPVANPTNPITPTSPMSPAVGASAIPAASAPGNPAEIPSPSLADQPSAQDGLMATGRGAVSDMVGDANANAAADSNAENNASGSTQNGRQVLRGPANSLVVPPAGISLTPNNGAAALTAPANPQ